MRQIIRHRGPWTFPYAICVIIISYSTQQSTSTLTTGTPFHWSGCENIPVNIHHTQLAHLFCAPNFAPHFFDILFYTDTYPTMAATAPGRAGIPNFRITSALFPPCRLLWMPFTHLFIGLQKKLVEINHSATEIPGRTNIRTNEYRITHARATPPH